MKRWLPAAVLVTTASLAGAPPALEFDWSIPLPGVVGRIDHFGFDVTGRRLFVAALGNNSVEVVDLARSRDIASITGLTEPQGVVFVPESNRLYVANGGDGSLRIYDGTTFAPLASIPFDDDADNLRYDPAARRVYVGHGSGALGAVDPASNRPTADVPLDAHPESFQLERSGSRIYVNVPGAHEIAVVDRARGAVVATWALGLVAANFPMALDESDHRLFVGCRLPARLVVFDTGSGREVARFDLHRDCDDLFFDAPRRRIYASCGEGYLDVYQQADADHYSLLESVATAPGARTSYFAGDRLFLAVPRRGDPPAEVRCYQVSP